MSVLYLGNLSLSVNKIIMYQFCYLATWAGLFACVLPKPLCPHSVAWSHLFMHMPCPDAMTCWSGYII